MKKLHLFQKFETERFLEGKKFVISTPSKVDEEKGRVKFQVAIVQDNTNYGTDTAEKRTGDNMFEKIYVSVYSPDFKSIKFNAMDEFDFGVLDNLRSSLFGEVYDRKLSISGDLKRNPNDKKKLPDV